MEQIVNSGCKIVLTLTAAYAVIKFVNKFDGEQAKEVSIHTIDTCKDLAIAISNR